MLDIEMREIKEQVFIPVADEIGGRIHPTVVTIIGGLVGVAAGVAAYNGQFIAGLLLWWLNRALDGLDGTIARQYDKKSDLGAYIDILLDDFVYALLPIMLVLNNPSTMNFVALAVMLGVFYVNSASWMFLSALLERRKAGSATTGERTSVTMPRGLIEGGETVVFFSLFFLLPAYLAPLFAVMSVLVAVTIIQRLRWSVHNL